MSTALWNTMTKVNTGRKGLFHLIQQTGEGSQGRNLSRNLKAGLKPKLRDSCLLAGLCLAQLAFLYIQDHWPRVALPNGRSHSTPTVNQKNVQQTHLQANLTEAFSQWKFPLPTCLGSNQIEKKKQKTKKETSKKQTKQRNSLAQFLGSNADLLVSNMLSPDSFLLLG